MPEHAPLDQCLEAFRREIDNRSPENSCKQWYHHALKHLLTALDAMKETLPPEQQDMLDSLESNLKHFSNAAPGFDQAKPWHEMNHALQRLLDQYKGKDREACYLSVRKIILCAQKQNPHLTMSKSKNKLFGSQSIPQANEAKKPGKEADPHPHGSH